MEDDDEFDGLGIDWDAEFACVDDEDLFGVDPFAEEHPDERVNAVEAALEEPLEDRTRTVYWHGRRYSGSSWSLGQPLSVVLYDKTLQARLTNRRHTEPIWKANGQEDGERRRRWGKPLPPPRRPFPSAPPSPAATPPPRQTLQLSI